MNIYNTRISKKTFLALFIFLTLIIGGGALLGNNKVSADAIDYSCGDGKPDSWNCICCTNWPPWEDECQSWGGTGCACGDGKADSNNCPDHTHPHPTTPTPDPPPEDECAGCPEGSLCPECGSVADGCCGTYSCGVCPDTQCFQSGTQITMANGSKKAIEDVKIGDELVGETRNNTVLELIHSPIDERRLYSINGSEFFVTGAHPFMTTQGWKAFNQEAAIVLNPDLGITQLNIGDILIKKDNEQETIETFQSTLRNIPVYNFELDGDQTYYADDFLVHNKQPLPCTYPYCGQPGSCYYCGGGGSTSSKPSCRWIDTDTTRKICTEQGKIQTQRNRICGPSGCSGSCTGSSWIDIGTTSSCPPGGICAGGECGTPLSTPQNLSLTSDTSSIIVQWTPLTDSDVGGYEIEYCKGEQCSPGGIPIEVEEKETSTETIEDLPLGITQLYRVRIRATLDKETKSTKKINSEWTEPIDIELKNPHLLRPNNVSIESNSPHSIYIQWDIVPGTSTAGYDIQYCKGIDCTPTTTIRIPDNKTNNHYIVTDPSSTYRVRIKTIASKNKGINSPYTPLQETTTLPADSLLQCREETT